VNLAGLRAQRAAFMPERCSISRYTETSTSDGVSQEWQEFASDVPCHVWPSGVSGDEGVGGAATLRALSTWTVALPYGTDITVKDRIAVSDARVFQVQRVDVRTYEASRDCVCELVS
jgi:head-tail adaptor